MSVLGIIPARKGSKGVPGKNMEMIAGKPLIGHTIEVAINSGVFDTLVVTSDSSSILEYAGKFNLVLHDRPSHLATDESPVIETVLAVLSFAESSFNKKYTSVFILQPTSPLRELWHLKEALQLLTDNPNAASVISVTKVSDNHPARMYKVDNGYLNPLVAEFEQMRRQELPPVYIRNGSIYITRREMLTAGIMAKPALAYPMDEKYHLNIDTLRDMQLAKLVMEGGRQC